MTKIKYFSAVWCAPCKLFKPIMQELKDEGLDIEFIDVDEDPTQTAKYMIRSVPTCVIEANGTEVNRWSGTLPKEEVRKRYNNQ